MTPRISSFSQSVSDFAVVDQFNVKVPTVRDFGWSVSKEKVELAKQRGQTLLLHLLPPNAPRPQGDGWVAGDWRDSDAGAGTGQREEEVRGAARPSFSSRLGSGQVGERSVIATISK